MANFWLEVMERDNNTCVYCGDKAVDVHHIISRRYRKIRHDVDNGISLCRKCHIEAEKHPAEFRGFIDNKYPDRYEKLWNKATRKIHQFR